MTSHEIDAISRRVDRLAANHVIDGLLDLAMTLARGGLPFPIGIVVSGVVVRGALSASTKTAQEVDAALLQVIDSMFVDSEELRAVTAGAFLKLAESIGENIKRARELLAAYPEDATIDDLSDEDFQGTLGLGVNAVIDLVDAKVLVSGQWIEVGVMRISIDQVGAWWPLASEEGTNIVFKTPSAGFG